MTFQIIAIVVIALVSAYILYRLMGIFALHALAKFEEESIDPDKGSTGFIVGMMKKLDEALQEYKDIIEKAGSAEEVMKDKEHAEKFEDLLLKLLSYSKIVDEAIKSMEDYDENDQFSKAIQERVLVFSHNHAMLRHLIEEGYDDNGKLKENFEIRSMSMEDARITTGGDDTW